MEGFFSKAETASMSSFGGRPLSCFQCGLFKTAKTPKMEPYGDFKKGILNLGEAPGETDDAKGMPWQGKAGKVLQSAYRRIGIDLFEDCLNINSVMCRPITDKGSNREPSPQELMCCRMKVMQIINAYKPKVIVALGGSAVTSLIGHRWRKALGGISRWRGWTIPDRDLKAWVCPVFHPSYVMRSEQEVETIWEADLARIKEIVETPFPDHPDETKQVRILEDRDEIINALNSMRAGGLHPDPSLLAFDYETTGLKPHDTSVHKLVYMAFCDSPNRAYAFMTPQHRSILRRLERLLTSEDIGKIAQNMKFEHSWTHNALGYEVKNWVWDTMQATHILDNRRQITGLKFQAYVQFGIMDYDSEVSPYLESKDKKNGNAVNRVEELIKTEAGRRKLLLYCGMDALLEYKLAEMQMRQVGMWPMGVRLK